MFSRNEVFLALPFDASSDASEPLIAAGDAKEQEDHRLEEKASTRFKLFSLLLGLLVGFYIQHVFFFVETISGEDAATKSKTGTVVLSLLYAFLSLGVMVFVVWELLRNTINYSAIWGLSKDFIEEMIAYMYHGFIVGTSLVGLLRMVENVLFDMRLPTAYYFFLSLGAFFWREIMIRYFATYE
jgi:hypothetical protein